MREIKFRGFSKDEEKWVYGYLVISRESPDRTAHFIIECDGDCNEPHKWTLVDPDSVGQYTGLKDKNGVEIYEGDVIKCAYCGKGNGEVVWNENMIRFQLGWDKECCGNFHLTRVGHWSEVIGNIYENPELLK